MKISCYAAFWITKLLRRFQLYQKTTENGFAIVI